jgi:hypothetical protein
MNQALQASVSDIVDETLYDYPDLSPMREAFNQVRSPAGSYDDDMA